MALVTEPASSSVSWLLSWASGTLTSKLRQLSKAPVMVRYEAFGRVILKSSSKSVIVRMGEATSDKMKLGDNSSVDDWNMWSLLHFNKGHRLSTIAFPNTHMGWNTMAEDNDKLHEFGKLHVYVSVHTHHFLCAEPFPSPVKFTLFGTATLSNATVLLRCRGRCRPRYLKISIKKSRTDLLDTTYSEKLLEISSHSRVESDTQSSQLYSPSAQFSTKFFGTRSSLCWMHQICSWNRASKFFKFTS